MLSIGAGVTGIMNAYHIQKFCENVEHVIFEKVKWFFFFFLEPSPA